MSQTGSDPYATLGLAADATDAEVRTAYRRLVLRHHPDHNNGSTESARRFEAVQDAYARVLASRRAAAAGEAAGTARAGGAARARAASTSASGGPGSGGAAAPDSELDARIAAMERELHEARLAQQRAREEAMRAASTQGPRRATPEELGYVTTDDSLGKIFDDATRELAERWSKSHSEPLSKRLTDLFRGSD